MLIAISTVSLLAGGIHDAMAQQTDSSDRISATSNLLNLDVTATSKEGEIILEWERPQMFVAEYKVYAKEADSPYRHSEIAHFPDGWTHTTVNCPGRTSGACYEDFGTNTNENQYTVTIKGLAPGKLQHIYVDGLNRSVVKYESSLLTATSLCAPGQPSNVVTTAGNHMISVSWEPPTNNCSMEITEYIVKAEYKQLGRAKLLESYVDGDSNSTVFTNLTNGEPYNISIYAVNDYRTGEPSDVQTVTPIGPPTAPRNVSGHAGDETVTLRWLKPFSDGGSPITGYVVAGRIGSVNSFTVMESVDESTTSVTLENLRNGVQYQFIVSAINDQGQGPPSRIAYATPSTVPDAPTNFSVTERQISDSAAIKWDKPNDGGKSITKYVLTIKSTYVAVPNSLPPLTEKLNIPANVTSYSTFGAFEFSDDNKYEFTLQAVNANGNSPPSESVTIIWGQPAGPPTKVP